jgi:hypothetical protein
VADYKKEEELIIKAAKKFEVGVYNKVFDTFIQSMTTRFIKNSALL